MGIEVFFSTLRDSYSDVIISCDDPRQLEATHIFIDFNSIIHTLSATMIKNINKYLENPGGEQPYMITNVDNYKKLINKNFEDKLLQQIQLYLDDLFTNHFIKSKIKTIYIAIDGVPSMAKMAEQKKRRYMGTLINDILDAGGKLEFNWSKNNITPGTSFMKKLNLFFDNYKVGSGITLEISNCNIQGEGETKIVNKFKNIKFKETETKYVYSPDSDVVLLCLLLHSNNLFMYRHNQQESKVQGKNVYNIVNIDKLGNILEKYVKSNILDNTKRKELKKTEIIDNIVFIFSLFGDDFLPRLESINTNSDFQLLIHTYILVYLKKGNIITKSINGYILKHKNLSLYFYLLNRKEDDMLQRNYFSRKYYNYRYANLINFELDIINMTETFTEIIKDFGQKSLNKFIKYFISNHKFLQLIKIIKINKHTTNNFSNFINNINRYIIPDELYNKLYGDTNSKYIILSNKSLIIKKLIEKTNIQYFLCVNDDDLIIDLLIYFYLNDGNLPLEDGYKTDSNKKLNKRIYYKEADHKINNYHKNILKQKSSREKQQYKLDRKLDDIYEKFNIEDKSFLKANDNSKKLYYSIYFDKNIKTQQIVLEYLKGFVWIFNHYYKHSNDYWWHYPYHKTPLINEIVNYYKFEPKSNKNIMADKLDLWDKHINNLEPKKYSNFLTPLEQLLYVSAFKFESSKLNDSLNLIKYVFESIPIDLITELNSYKVKSDPKEYPLKILENIRKFIENKKDIFFIDVSSIKNQILNFKSNKIIDCTTSHFISKCHIHNILISSELVKQYIKEFRNILPLEDQVKILETK